MIKLGNNINEIFAVFIDFVTSLCAMKKNLAVYI